MFMDISENRIFLLFFLYIRYTILHTYYTERAMETNIMCFMFYWVPFLLRLMDVG